MTARRNSKRTEATEATDGPVVIKTVPRPGGLEAVYERHPDGRVERTVREATTPAAVEPSAADAADAADDTAKD